MGRNTLPTKIMFMRDAFRPYFNAEMKRVVTTNYVITDYSKRSPLGKTVCYAGDEDMLVDDMIVDDMNVVDRMEVKRTRVF